MLQSTAMMDPGSLFLVSPRPLARTSLDLGSANLGREFFRRLFWVPTSEHKVLGVSHRLLWFKFCSRSCLKTLHEQHLLVLVFISPLFFHLSQGHGSTIVPGASDALPMPLRLQRMRERDIGFPSQHSFGCVHSSSVHVAP